MITHNTYSHSGTALRDGAASAIGAPAFGVSVSRRAEPWPCDHAPRYAWERDSSLRYEKQKSPRRRHAFMRHSLIYMEGVMGRKAVNTMALIEDVLSARISADSEDLCQLWTGYRNSAGYGQIEIDGRVWLAHRLVWTVRRGRIPAGLLVLHRCDTPLCVNPDHLFLGTPRDNARDSIEKGRSLGRIPDWGVRKRRIRKLTDDQVRAIRAADGKQREIAERFGVSRSHVAMIRSGRAKGLITDATMLDEIRMPRDA